MDEQNPAVGKQVQIPPAFLEEVGQDPRALEAWCRKLYLVGVDKVHRAMRDPNIPLGQRMAWLDHLAKYGGLGQQRQQATTGQGSGFSVQIVLNNPAESAKPAPAVIDVQATPVQAQATDE